MYQGSHYLGGLPREQAAENVRSKGRQTKFHSGQILLVIYMVSHNTLENTVVGIY